MEKFGNRLKSLRQAKGLKQTDMMEMLNITQRHYYRMEHGQVNVPALSLIALADYFDVSLDYLVGRSDDPKRY